MEHFVRARAGVDKSVVQNRHCEIAEADSVTIIQSDEGTAMSFANTGLSLPS